MADFESPVVARHQHGDDAVTLTDESSTPKFVVRSDGRQFAVDFGATALVEGSRVCGSRPGEWLVLGSASECAAALATVDTEPFTNVIEVTHGRALFRLIGDAAGSVLAKVCSLDLSDDMTPDGAVVSGSVAGVSCDLVRADLEGRRGYLIAADRSFGQYLFDALVDAGTEFAIGFGMRPRPSG